QAAARATAETKDAAPARRALPRPSPDVLAKAEPVSRREHAPRPEPVQHQTPTALTHADGVMDVRATLSEALQARQFEAAERQAALWANLHNCDAVRLVLADMSPEYGYDDWMRLGDCSEQAAPGLALDAYARAHARQPGDRGSHALAYSAFASGDYRTALEAWR